MVKRRIVVKMRKVDDLDHVQRLGGRWIISGPDSRRGVEDQIFIPVEAVECIAGDGDHDPRDVVSRRGKRRPHIRDDDHGAWLEI